MVVGPIEYRGGPTIRSLRSASSPELAPPAEHWFVGHVAARGEPRAELASQLRKDMELPTDLINQVRQGRAVLFLGAGASRKAKDPNGKEPPLGDELRDRIAERFLTDKYASETLTWVAELAISSSSLF